MAGLIGSILLGYLAVMNLLIPAWGVALGKSFDLIAIPVRFLLFLIPVNNADDLFWPYVILTVLYFAGIGYFLGRFVIYVLNRLNKTPSA